MSNNNQDYSNLQDSFNKLSIKEKTMNKEQSLKNSTYNILEAYNDNIPSDFSLILDCQSIHPLQSYQPYNLDLNPARRIKNNDSDISELIETLDLNDDTSTMPYCA